jgi:hypothetical protein
MTTTAKGFVFAAIRFGSAIGLGVMIQPTIAPALELTTSQSTTAVTATKWWSLLAPLGSSSYDRNAFTICEEAVATPADKYEYHRDLGHFPKINDYGDKVTVSWEKTDPVTPLTAVIKVWVTYYRTKAACEAEAEARRLAAQRDKELKQYR